MFFPVLVDSKWILVQSIRQKYPRRQMIVHDQYSFHLEIEAARNLAVWKLHTKQCQHLQRDSDILHKFQPLES